MSSQWMDMRIQEEQERRRKEATILELLPRGLEELNELVSSCLDKYKEAFGAEAADVTNLVSKLRITVREQQGGKWHPRAKVDVALVSVPPAFKVELGEAEPFLIEIGLLPGDRLSYRFNDQYLTPEDLAKKVLDRALFPKLAE